MKFLNVETTGNQNFKDLDTAGQHSQTVRTMLDDFDIEEDTNKNEDTTVHLHNDERPGKHEFISIIPI